MVVVWDVWTMGGCSHMQKINWLIERPTGRSRDGYARPLPRPSAEVESTGLLCRVWCSFQSSGISLERFEVFSLIYWHTC